MSEHKWRVVDDPPTSTTSVYLDGSTVMGRVSEEGLPGAESTGVWQGTVEKDPPYLFSKKEAVAAVKEPILSHRSGASS